VRDSESRFERSPGCVFTLEIRIYSGLRFNHTVGGSGDAFMCYDGISITEEA